MDVSSFDFIRGLKSWFRPWSAIFGLIKGFFFGLTITSIACYFGFYTKVSIDGYTVNLKINQTADPLKFDLDPTDIDLMVESFYNTVETSGSGVDSGSQAGNFVKVDDASDISMGNGGSDTYVIAGVNSGTKVVGGTVLEYGDVNQTVGGLNNSIDDSINFSSVSDIHQLKISRGEIKNEATDSSLFISDVNDSSPTKSVVFDNYNEYYKGAFL